MNGELRLSNAIKNDDGKQVCRYCKKLLLKTADGVYRACDCFDTNFCVREPTLDGSIVEVVKKRLPHRVVILSQDIKRI